MNKKCRETRDQIANIQGSLKKQESSRKQNHLSALLTMPKPLTVWITINWEIFLNIIDCLYLKNRAQRFPIFVSSWVSGLG